MFKYIGTFFLFFSSIGLSQIDVNSSQPFIFPLNLGDSGELVEVIMQDKLMGSTFMLTVIDSSYDRASKICKEAASYGRQIEAKISSWDVNSQTSKINKYAGIMPVKIDKDLFGLIARSKKISELTDGAFDISYASMDQIWDFTKDTIDLPTNEEVVAAVSKVNYKNIILNKEDTTVFLKTPGMKIGFGAIGKGYLADEIKKFLISNGIQSGIVNAGGDLVTWGSPINDTAWEIGIANPKFKNSVLGQLKIKNKAIVTSGDYEKFFTIKGRKFCHIINPNTGYPAFYVNSVSVLCNSAELADALATAIFIMGEERGIELINKLNGIDAVVIKNKKIFTSNNIDIQGYEKTEPIIGEYKFFADNGALKPCGTNKWEAISFLDPGKAEKEYMSTLDGYFTNTVLLTAKGSYVQVKRESRTITIFKVSEIVKMEMKECD